MTRHHSDGLVKRCGCTGRQWPKCVHACHLAFRHRGDRYRFSLDVVARTLGEPRPVSRGEAKDLAYRIRAELRAGRNPMAPPPAQPAVTGLTFGDVCDRYLTEYFGKIDTPDGPRWTGRRPQTGQDAWYHLNIVRKVIVPAGNGQHVRLERKPFTAVSTIDVRTVQSERRPHGATGCNRLMARLRHLFNWSIAEGMIDHTPFKRGDVTLVKLDTHAERERTRRLQPGRTSTSPPAREPALAGANHRGIVDRVSRRRIAESAMVATPKRRAERHAGGRAASQQDQDPRPPRDSGVVRVTRRAGDAPDRPHGTTTAAGGLCLRKRGRGATDEYQDRVAEHLSSRRYRGSPFPRPPARVRLSAAGIVSGPARRAGLSRSRQHHNDLTVRTEYAGASGTGAGADGGGCRDRRRRG